VKKILLTKGQLAIVDDFNFEWLNQWKWCASKSGNQYYAKAWIDNKMIRMHRLIMNPPDDKQIDHKNHNGLDNRKSNLRLCTQAQNIRHQKPQTRKTSSKYKGVSWDRAKWCAYIKYQRKTIHLGAYHNEIEAAKVYDAKALELFGEFACTNF